LDYSVEGKEEEDQFDAALAMTLKTVEFAKERLAHLLFLNQQVLVVLNCMKTWRKGLNVKRARGMGSSSSLVLICSEAKQKNVALLIGGEESWMQDAADDLVQDDAQHNKEKSNCFQYFTNVLGSIDYLKKVTIRQQREGFLSVWLVRGEFMEKKITGRKC
jgi:proline dehydrogenase